MLTKQFAELRETAQNALATLQVARGDAGEEEAARAFFGHPAVRNPVVLGHDKKLWEQVNAWLKGREDYNTAILLQLATAIQNFLDEITL